MDQTEWHRLRTELNHDWLKNVYLPALDAWLSILDGDVSDPDWEETYLKSEFIEWEKYLGDLWELSRGFQKANSPSRIFICEPLQSIPAETHGWLIPLADALWQSRCGIQEKQDTLHLALAEADSVYVSLRHALEQLNASSFTPVVSIALRSKFYRFRNCCVNLGQAISVLPRLSI